MNSSETRGSLVIWISLLALLCFFVWASQAELEQITRAPGQIIASGRTQVIQASDGGVLQALMVKEGDTVERGQVLAYAATMLKAVDNPKALTFAQQATEAAPQLTQAWMALGVVHDEAKTRKKDAVAALVQALSTPATPHQTQGLPPCRSNAT